MIQHSLLLTAPGLLLLGQPLLPVLRGLPDPVRRLLVAPLLRRRSLRAAVHALVHPLAALLLSSVIFWSWHLPALYQLALRVPSIHLVEHASFLAGGFLFWYPVVQPWPGRARWPAGAMIPYLLVADVQNTVLAALLTFSDRVLYPFYEIHGRATEAAALDDQVLAGVIMWVPMSLAYLVPAVLLTIRLLSPKRVLTTNEPPPIDVHLIRSLDAPGGMSALPLPPPHPPHPHPPPPPPHPPPKHPPPSPNPTPPNNSLPPPTTPPHPHTPHPPSPPPPPPPEGAQDMNEGST